MRKRTNLSLDAGVLKEVDAAREEVTPQETRSTFYETAAIARLRRIKRREAK